MFNIAIMAILFIIVVILMALTFRIFFYFLSKEGFEKYYKSNKRKLILAYTLGTPIIFIVYCVVAVIAIGILPHEVDNIVAVLKCSLSIVIIATGVYLVYIFKDVWRELKRSE